EQVRAVKTSSFWLCFLCRKMDNMSGQDLNYEDMQRKDQRLPFQIFPDPVEVVLSPDTTRLDHDREKERLPSIVVEPTELSEVESGELRWPPENIDMEEDEEDLFLEQCIPPANIADWGEEEEEEETSVVLTQQPGLTLIDLQSDAFRDDTPTLPPSGAPAIN
uniref:LBH domain-containing protein n=1 Tax=Mola mola TaxID=94237 RepID=A0A3Q3WC64_MOLML